MFFFVNFKSPQLTSYDKGILFEGLVKELVDLLGYKDIELRAKKSGKEYDIKALAKLGSRPLIGQAKAYETSIASQHISEFVGSLDLRDIPENTLGLFISTSELTPDAKEFISNLKNEKKERVEIIAAKQIFERLVQINYPSIEDIKRKAQNKFNNKPGDTYLLVSDRGNYFVQLLVRPNETRPKAFCVLDKSGNFISDLGDELKARINELKELSFLKESGTFASILDVPSGPIGLGPEGATWFEYKLPAPPQFFIGRSAQANDFETFLQTVRERQTGIRIYQVLSPSGVGKSSYLLKLQDIVKHRSCMGFEDARNFRSSVDLLALIQSFLESCQKSIDYPEIIPSDTQSVLQIFSGIDKELQKKDLIGIIFIDQFESLFQKPDLFAYFLDLTMRITHESKNIVFCLARRNDQPTTYDDRIDLDLPRLASLSKSIELKDFSRSEAKELLSHLAEELNQPIKNELQNVALEFAASGFPWLCKRVGAHILDTVKNKGLRQEELIQNGIKLEELFKEDLASLDIIDKEFLKDLAKYLPATLDELSQKFDGQKLTSKLKLLQDQRLIRLIGRTYDTYNDVFKEYLKTGEIPLPSKFVFRSSPSTTRKTLDAILENKYNSVKELSENYSRIKHDTMQNVLRELKVLGFIETTRGQFTIDQETINAYKKGELDVLIRDRVWKKNGLVKDILNSMATQEKITLDQLIEYMKTSLPVLEITNVSWTNYARTFVSWLRFVGLIKPGQIVGDKNKALGATRSTLLDSDTFLPSIYVSEIIEFIERTDSTKWIKRVNSNYKHAIDCARIGLIELDDEQHFYRLTELGKEFKTKSLNRPKIIKDFLLTLHHIQKYLIFIKNSNKKQKHESVLKTILGDMAYTDETWGWRSKLTANWLEFSGLISRKSGYIYISQQSSMFDQQKDSE